MMLLFVEILSCLLLSGGFKSEKTSFNNIQRSPQNILSSYCSDFDKLNTRIRDNKISRKEALKEVQLLLPKIKELFYSTGGSDFAELAWYFPVENYNARAIGGTNGNGYVLSTYDYFDGNKHLGHPAHDIFITDRNQDCTDDRTSKQVNVVSVTGGIVIATDTVWQATSDLRGGKYIWIYDPSSNSMFYYAHNGKVFVKLGDIIKPGQVIAAVGRTGLNAYKKRSPTHLHIMQLKLDIDNYPRPYNCYRALIKAKVSV